MTGKSKESVTKIEEGPLLKLKPPEPVIVADEKPLSKLEHPVKNEAAKPALLIEPVDLRAKMTGSYRRAGVDSDLETKKNAGNILHFIFV